MTAPVARGSWVTWVMGQELSGSLGSWVTLSDPFPALVWLWSRGAVPPQLKKVGTVIVKVQHEINLLRS